ncbi:MAG: cupredoxin domain-containing protein [candidate division Zixibacteria bacterium]|nr:cupredoxin domain-containing protein [candidate division Zixibacteria bacterium]
MFQAKRFLLSAALVFLFLSISLRGESSTSALKTVSVVDFAFVPPADTILVGDSILWINNGGFPHTSTSDSGVWDSDSLHSQSFTFQFNIPGSYPYACQYHPFTMTGTIVVKPTQLHNVSIVDFAFSPQVDTITAGDSVQWTNNGAFTHTSTSNTLIWNSGNLAPGQSFTVQYNTPGSFPYHCAIHLSMTATIVVKPAAVHTVSIIDFAFVPQTDTITAADNVRWVNNRAVFHTTTSNTSVWNSGTLSPGPSSFTRQFNTSGSFPYQCKFHPSMTGTILVRKRGDANGDSKITVSDVVYLVNYLFKGGPPPNPLLTGDANCDTKVTVSDVVYLVNYLFKGGPPPC